MSSLMELISLFALWQNQFDPTFFIIWFIERKRSFGLINPHGKNYVYSYLYTRTNESRGKIGSLSKKIPKIMEKVFLS